MTAPRIVVHVGAPKTGSTWLQRVLRTEPDLWRRHGVYVPVLPEVARQAGNAKLLGAVLGAEAPGFRRGFPDVDPTTLDPAEVVARLLAGWERDRETVVLSAENLGPEQAAPLRELLPADVEVTIVLVVRNQYRWIESYHRQMVKMMHFEEGLSELVSAVLDGGTRYRPDWLHIYESFQAAFGNCRVILYEEAAADLFSAFAAASGLDVPPALSVPEPANVSPDAYGTAYLLGVKRPVEISEFARRRIAAREASARSRLPSLRYLKPRDCARLREEFEPGNRRLLALLRRSYEGSPLDLSDPVPGGTDLRRVYRSRSYRSYRRLADSIFAELG